MNNSIFKELQKSIFNKKFQNIGYLPRWIIFAIDVAIVAVALFVKYLIINSLSVPEFDGYFDLFTRCLMILAINAISFMVYRTYSGIIRHSTFIDGIKLLVATTSSYIVLLCANFVSFYIFKVKLFLSTGLFITYVISFLLLFLFRILVKNVFEKFTIKR
ncbi:MAG: hypothetical protein R2805_08650 [Flavobacterium sp.]|uniref:hypothetical protein n=1 Tax=Flavobacterium sp. TaxID=239 RepID=UPI0035296F43